MAGERKILERVLEEATGFLDGLPGRRLRRVPMLMASRRRYGARCLMKCGAAGGHRGADRRRRAGSSGNPVGKVLRLGDGRRAACRWLPTG